MASKLRATVESILWLTCIYSYSEQAASAPPSCRVDGLAVVNAIREAGGTIQRAPAFPPFSEKGVVVGVSFDHAITGKNSLVTDKLIAKLEAFREIEDLRSLG